MASIIAHEIMEVSTDPLINAWCAALKRTERIKPFVLEPVNEAPHVHCQEELTSHAIYSVHQERKNIERNSSRPWLITQPLSIRRTIQCSRR